MLKKFMLSSISVFILILILPWGIYKLNETTGLPIMWGKQVPVLQDGINFMSYAGEGINKKINLLQIETEEFVDNNPLLKATVPFIQNLAESVLDFGKNLFIVISSYLFPDPETIVQQENARMMILTLDKEIKSKQQELDELKQNMNQMENKKSALQKIANPLRNLQPEGFGFLAFPDLPILTSNAGNDINANTEIHKADSLKHVPTGKDVLSFPVNNKNPDTTTPNPNFATVLEKSSDKSNQCSCP